MQLKIYTDFEKTLPPNDLVITEFVPYSYSFSFVAISSELQRESYFFRDYMSDACSVWWAVPSSPLLSSKTWQTSLKTD